MIRIPVPVAPRAYDVVVDEGVVARTGAFLRRLFPERQQVFVVTVRPVLRPWGKVLKQSLQAAGFRSVFIETPDGEAHKRLAAVERLATKLLQAGADRKAIVVAFGGGMVGDLAGLTASLYMRGVDLVNVPTTVLGQVDASVGGKTAVNLRSGKNMLGTFYQPAVVLSDPSVLATLSPREYRSGLYEALKAGVIGSPALFRCFVEEREKIMVRDPETLRFVISESVRVKARIVAADEREDGLRRVLNLGHTVGHALEVQTRYRLLLHGEAVAWGMIAATHMATLLGKLDPRVAEVMQNTVFSLGPLPRVDVRAQSLIEHMRSDKKTEGGAIHLVIPMDVGKVEVVRDVPEGIIADGIAHMRQLARGQEQVQVA
ncbi:MAG: 3-dehydroquinate synthase [Acidobacteriales bacterium]|nr:3-dehydroquinate synthase [Terriglobales bacterium]